jgi:hypothetical protein
MTEVSGIGVHALIAGERLLYHIVIAYLQAVYVILLSQY